MLAELVEEVLGTIEDEKNPINAAKFQVLLKGAEILHLSPVKLDLADYLNLPPLEKLAIYRVGLQTLVRQAQRIGCASQTRLGPALVEAELDGGELHDQLLLLVEKQEHAAKNGISRG